MIVTSNRIPVDADYAEQFEQAFQDRASLVDHMPGFIAFQLLRPAKPDAPYIVMTFWESHDHFTAWTESDEFKEGHARSGTLPRKAFLGHPKIEIHEVIQSTMTIDKPS